jgi:sugar-specific transcriptional regulator TrmB
MLLRQQEQQEFNNMAIGAVLSSAIGLGAQLYNTNVSRSDKRKVRKQLRKLAKNSGIAYADLKADLDSLYAKTIADSSGSNAYDKVLKEVLDNANEETSEFAKPTSSSPQEFKSELKNRIKSNVSGDSAMMDKVLSLDNNLYASAIKDWSNEQNQDYRQYADALQTYQDWLKNRNTMSQNYQKALYDQDKNYTDLVAKRISTLMNMDMGNMQTQNAILSQIQGI